jgi:hypothetical protein
MEMLPKELQCRNKPTIQSGVVVNSTPHQEHVRSLGSKAPSKSGYVLTSGTTHLDASVTNLRSDTNRFDARRVQLEEGSASYSARQKKQTTNFQRVESRAWSQVRPEETVGSTECNKIEEPFLSRKSQSRPGRLPPCPCSSVFRLTTTAHAGPAVCACGCGGVCCMLSFSTGEYGDSLVLQV